MYCVDIRVYKDPEECSYDYTEEYKEFNGFYGLINFIYDLLHRYNLDYIEYNKELHLLELWSEEYFETNKTKVELRNISYIVKLSDYDMKVLSDMNMYGEM